MRYTILNPEQLDDKQNSSRQRRAFLKVQRTSWLNELFGILPEVAEVAVEYDLGDYSYFNRSRPPEISICFRDEVNRGEPLRTRVPWGLKRAVIKAWKDQADPIPRPWKTVVGIPKAKVVDRSDKL